MNKYKEIRSMLLVYAGERITYYDGEVDLDIVEDLDPSELTKEELLELGFKDHDGLMLIPIWLYPFLAKNIETEDTSGELHIWKSSIEPTPINGVLAYGVYPKC